MKAYVGLPYTPLADNSSITSNNFLSSGNGSGTGDSITSDDFFSSGNAPKRCCCEWIVSLCRCLLAPLAWIKCIFVGLFQCVTWSCPSPNEWDFVIYLLRFVAYAASTAGVRDGTLQAVVDLSTIAGPILSIWLGKGVSRCAVSSTLNPTETLGGRGEWLWPKGEGRNNDTAPPLPETHPKVILYFHGGAFVLCNSVTHRVITYELCRRTNVPVCVPLYSRPPHAKFPLALNQMTDIYENFVSHYGASNIILAGDSAGGNLCLTTCLNSFQNRGLPPPGKVVLLSPWCDLTVESESQPSMKDNAPTDYLPVPLISRFSADYLPDDTMPDNPLVSPLFADASDLRSACPNVFLCYGTGEELLDQNRILAQMLQPTELVELEKMPHVSPLFSTPIYGANAAVDENNLPQPAYGLSRIVDFINTN